MNKNIFHVTIDSEDLKIIFYTNAVTVRAKNRRLTALFDGKLGTKLYIERVSSKEEIQSFVESYTKTLEIFRGVKSKIGLKFTSQASIGVTVALMLANYVQKIKNRCEEVEKYDYFQLSNKDFCIMTHPVDKAERIACKSLLNQGHGYEFVRVANFEETYTFLTEGGFFSEMIFQVKRFFDAVDF